MTQRAIRELFQQLGWHKATVTLLQNRPRTLTLEVIAKKTNTNIHWLERLARDEIPEPGINKVQRVYKFLTTHSEA